MATRDDFRDANGVTAAVVGSLLQCHAPDLQDAILNSSKTPALDEEGFQMVSPRTRACKTGWRVWGGGWCVFCPFYHSRCKEGPKLRAR